MELNSQTTNAPSTEVKTESLDRLALTFQTAQMALQGLLSGPNFNVLLVNAMASGARVTLGHIVCDEAWDMAEALVDKYQEKLATDAVQSSK
jgi:hypothetical protein